MGGMASRVSVFLRSNNLGYWDVDEYDAKAESRRAYYYLTKELRVDGGLMLPETLSIGQRVGLTNDLYEDGMYIGSMAINVELLALTTIKVWGKVFTNCLRLRVTRCNRLSKNLRRMVGQERGAHPP